MDFSVTLNEINSFSYAGVKFLLPSNIMRYFEFENIAVFWLRNEGKENHVVGVKLTDNPHNHFYIAWEYIVGDWAKYQDKASYVRKITVSGDKQLLEIGTTDCIIYLLNPYTGEVMSKTLSKW